MNYTLAPLVAIQDQRCARWQRLRRPLPSNPRRAHYIILIVKHILLCRATGSNSLLHTAREILSNGDHGIALSSNLALDYLI
jgi:hypothetical protein